MSVFVKPVSKDFAKDHVLEIANLRIKIFKEFPYIYEGTIDYEVKYIQRYFDAMSAQIILAFDENLNNKIVGLATCLKAAEESDFIKTPLLLNGFNLEKTFYFGESLLLQKYRGQGLGKKFFDEREKVALSHQQVTVTCFCAVDRPSDHYLRPKNYKPLDHFWSSRGYHKSAQIKSELTWLDINQKTETTKQMTFWMKKWNQ